MHTCLAPWEMSPKTEKRLEQVLARIKEGESVKAALRKIGMSPRTWSRWLKRSRTYPRSEIGWLAQEFEAHYEYGRCELCNRMIVGPSVTQWVPLPSGGDVTIETVMQWHPQCYEDWHDMENE